MGGSHPRLLFSAMHLGSGDVPGKTKHVGPTLAGGAFTGDVVVPELEIGDSKWVEASFVDGESVDQVGDLDFILTDRVTHEQFALSTGTYLLYMDKELDHVSVIGNVNNQAVRREAPDSHRAFSGKMRLQVITCFFVFLATLLFSPSS